MDTEKLYDRDAFLKEFDAVVTDCRPGKGDTYLVTLDRTAFYPEGGGQPADRGDLGGAAVLDVQERDGLVLHTCDRPLTVGASVHGAIDWSRRFDHMQQHSGEHIVSGMLCAAFSCDNVGFHMGADVVTIDYNAPMTWEQVLEVEARANRYIWENHPFRAYYPAPEELAAIPYRSKKALEGPVRITEFPGADCCACCGTHVRSAGQVGLIKLLTVQKFRSGCRIELVCGGRALDYLRGALEQNRQVSRLLSAKLFQTGAAVERLLAENEGHKARCARLEEDRFAALARQYAGAGDVVLFEEGLSPDALRRLCDAVLRACGGRCACLSGGEGAGWQYAVGAPDRDLRPLAKEMNAALDGRGGGKPDFIQGILQADRARIEAFFRTH